MGNPKYLEHHEEELLEQPSYLLLKNISSLRFSAAKALEKTSGSASLGSW
jgi:hypothetical protein